jgi:hypothetical protein
MKVITYYFFMQSFPYPDKYIKKPYLNIFLFINTKQINFNSLTVYNGIERVDLGCLCKTTCLVTICSY